MANREYAEEEKAQALAALAASGGEVSRTARQLGIPRRTLRGWAEAARARESGEAESLPFDADEVTEDRLTACPTVCARGAGTGVGREAEARSLLNGALADELEAVARRLTVALHGKIEEATLQQTATALGIVVTKMQLLRASGEGGGSAECLPRIYIPDNGREEEAEHDASRP